MDNDLIFRKDARHAVLHNEGQAAVAAIEEIPAVEMRQQIYGYDLENLRLFAELCKAQGVTDKDLKNVESDATWAAQTVFDANERAFRQAVMERTENGVEARFAVELPPPINPARFEHVFDDVPKIKMPPIKMEMPVRLIDANALIPKMRNRFWKRGREGDAICLIEDAPTVDAVPVVASDRNKLCPINHGLRCKDIDNCAFWCEWGQCAVKAIAIACADGERRTE